MDRDCVPAVPKPRKRRTESAVGLDTEQHGMSLLEFAGPSSSSTAAPPPQFDTARPKQTDNGAERNFLLGRHDLSHVDSKSFVQLFRQGLGNILVSLVDAFVPARADPFWMPAFVVYKYFELWHL